ncbi:WcaI family glycosyltransferase [Pedobacter sp. MC2016-05]|uniref:WcaI family glycosyltransferase n=1 Tax=Pedobacter sp. MC2016-05 TaxID=2994474 RepID=UPI00224872A3|nr:WcaI family glycosyltransferase [Pedobacter sp. MC2016-05]MCX2473238.1 WcaI family glycosyltransferase [Pedobacter sp. MC2016-05]
MRVLVLGINCFPELTGIGKYSGEMVNWLAAHDHHTTMVTTFPYYPYWEVQPPYKGNFYKKDISHGGNLIIYRCPMYIPKVPSGFKRLLHEATFVMSSWLVVFRLLFKKKYDIIFTIAPPFHLGFLALFYRFFKGGKIIYHIQDLQVDASKELKMLPSVLFPALFALERLILKNVDYVSTISDGMIKRVKDKVNKKILFFPNWVDTVNFSPLPHRDLLKPEWGFNVNQKIILYSGSIGEKQGLDSLIRIAKTLRSNPHIQFVICGTGPYKEKLISMAAADELTNVHFLPLQRDAVFNKFLNMADVHLVLQKKDASDLVMPSKLTTILSVGGLALVTANVGTTLCDVVRENEMGVVIEPENEPLLAQTILSITESDMNSSRLNARAYAERYLNKKNILAKILADIS